MERNKSIFLCANKMKPMSTPTIPQGYTKDTGSPAFLCCAKDTTLDSTQITVRGKCSACVETQRQIPPSSLPSTGTALGVQHQARLTDAP